MKGIKYKVNEIFYSLQAEGFNAGRAAVFVRFAGCNLQCKWCDTNHDHFTEMTHEQICNEVEKLDPTGEAIVVFTGGEPTLQLREDAPFFPRRTTTIETNGIIKPPSWIDYITVSPKTKIPPRELVTFADEIKIVEGVFEESYFMEIENTNEDIRLYIQPKADKDGFFDISNAMSFAMKHPKWKVSLQWHKLLNIR